MQLSKTNKNANGKLNFELLVGVRLLVRRCTYLTHTTRSPRNIRICRLPRVTSNLKTCCTPRCQTNKTPAAAWNWSFYSSTTIIEETHRIDTDKEHTMSGKKVSHTCTNKNKNLFGQEQPNPDPWGIRTDCLTCHNIQHDIIRNTDRLKHKISIQLHVLSLLQKMHSKTGRV